MKLMLLLVGALALGLPRISAAETVLEFLGRESPPVQAAGQAELEKVFQEALTGATFVGRWNLVEGDRMGEERDERYTIQTVRKISDELWAVYARIQYGQRDVTVPVPVQVKWAGDTPVISITNLALPGLGTYTARVVVYEGSYAGTWSGGNYKGLMHGLIMKSPAAASNGQERKAKD